MAQTPTATAAVGAISPSTLAAHSLRVSAIVAGVNAKPADKKISVRKATTSHQIHHDSWKDSCHRVDVSALDNILGFKQGVDRAGRACTLAVCEGQVTMEILVKACLPLGLIPYCVPEFPDFTVAGLINGEGIQTSAYKWGLFTHAVVEIEAVLGNGEIITATHEDPFMADVIESYGTLCVVVSATLALRPAMPFVRTSYTLFSSLPEFCKVFDTTVRAQEGDFLEGLAFGDNCYLMVQSRFVPERENLPFYDPKPYDCESGDLYYYQYLEQTVIAGNTKSPDPSACRLRIYEDVSPTEGFVFRSARWLWWITEAIVGLKALTNQRWFRRMCDKKVQEAMRTTGFKPKGVLTVEETQRCRVDQDMGIKLSRLEEGIRYEQRNLGVYPLWLCPITNKHSKMFTEESLKLHPDRAKALGDEFLVDIGIYGEPTVKPFRHRRVVKELRDFVDSPSNWGVSYKDKETVRREWAPVRAKYHADHAFPSIDEKIVFRSSEADAADNEESIPHWRLVDS